MLVVLLLSVSLRSPRACLTAGSRGRTTTQVLRHVRQPPTGATEMQSVSPSQIPSSVSYSLSPGTR